MNQFDVRLDGFEAPIGMLFDTANQAVRFQYNSEYLKNVEAIPLSLSMPLTDAAYDDILTRAYFNNLLQERDAFIALGGGWVNL